MSVNMGGGNRVESGGVYEKFEGYEGGSMKKTMTEAAGGSIKNKWMISLEWLKGVYKKF